MLDLSFPPAESFDTGFRRLVQAAEAGLADGADPVGSAPVVALVDALLAHVLGERATHVHLEPDESALRVRCRVDGLLQPGPSLPLRLAPAMVARLKQLAGLDVTETHRPQLGRMRLPARSKVTDLRLQTFPSRQGEDVVLHASDPALRDVTPASLGLAADDRARLERILDRRQGLFVVAGPRGSGRTTTLYAAAARLAAIDVNVVTVESLVEAELAGVRQLDLEANAGLAAEDAVAAAIRQDADVLLVGELGASALRAAADAALAGQLVLTSLPAATTAGVFAHLVDAGISPRLLAEALAGTCVQQLVRRACPHCRLPVRCPVPRQRELETAAEREQIAWSGDVVEAQGCEVCRFRGYSGRLALFELFEITPQVRERLAASGAFPEALLLASKQRTLRADALRHALAGDLTLEELERVAGSA